MHNIAVPVIFSQNVKLCLVLAFFSHCEVKDPYFSSLSNLYCYDVYAQKDLEDNHSNYIKNLKVLRRQKTLFLAKTASVYLFYYQPNFSCTNKVRFILIFCAFR